MSQTRPTIAVAMSGGVDSSVAAALLQEQGRDVFGITAIMSPGGSRCCSDEDVCTAQRVAGQLGIAHHVVDLSAEFQRLIIDPFMAEYLAGRTPSPCVWCNRHIKFGFLWEQARALGAGALATGHYVRRLPAPSSEPAAAEPLWALRRGFCREKDQSYFLALLTQAQLARSLFPLGEMNKPEVTAYACRRDLACRGSKESQELCFILEGTHGTWIDVRSLHTRGPGEIVDAGGRVLGRHHGIHHYTIGQRKGLGIAVGRPAYVTRIDAATNRVVVGDREQALRNSLRVEGLSWISGHSPAEGLALRVQIRYNHEGAPAILEETGDGRGRVVFAEPQFAVTPGQWAAFYDGDEVLGGGWIVSDAGEGG